MADWLQLLVDERSDARAASAKATTVRDALVSAGWILPSVDGECALGASGHRPGANVASWYARERGEVDFANLSTNGVVIAAGSFTNLAAAPMELDRLACPACGVLVGETDVAECVVAWMSGAVDATVACPSCGRACPLRSLRSRDERASPIVCGHLALTFHNWPPLDSPRWRRSIVEDIAEVVGSPPSLAWAKI